MGCGFPPISKRVGFGSFGVPIFNGFDVLGFVNLVEMCSHFARVFPPPISPRFLPLFSPYFPIFFHFSSIFPLFFSFFRTSQR